MNRVAIVLPPREGFSPAAVGAVGLLVRRLAGPGDVVVGAPTATAPFPDRCFIPAPPSRLPLGRAWRYAQGVARALGLVQPAMIEVHNRPEIALMLARRFPRTPMRLFLHNDPQAMRRAKTATQRAVLLQRMRVAVVSDYLRGRFLEGLGSQARVEILPNCLDLSELPPALPPERRERTILFAGRVVADKGADLFVAACAHALPHLPGWRAEMIGADRFSPDSPSTPFLAGLVPEAAAAGIAMTGHLSHAEVLAAMSRAAIVVVPSRWQEPFGLTALEAMACGAALIATPRGGLPEVVGDAALLVAPEVAALAEALASLARDEALLARLQAAGPRRARGFDVGPARARLAGLRAAAPEGAGV